MNSSEHLFIDKFRKYKTNINNMYWGFLVSKQHDLWIAITSQYKKLHSNNALHIVVFLYKIYLTKNKKSISPKQIPEPIVPKPKQIPEQIVTKPKPHPIVSTPQEPVILQHDSLTPAKQKFTGAYRHTPGSNYKEWKKAQQNIKTYEKIETKIFNKWKEEDNFDPKKYNITVPWFEYIKTCMD